MKKLVLLLMSIFVLSQAHAQSLGEVARKNRPKSTDTTTKRVWTTDDFPSTGYTGAPVPLAETPESASSTLQKFRSLGEEELGAAVLKMANAPNVDFPDRKNWEQKLFDAKRAWLDQADRMMAHKDSSKATRDTELRLTQGAQQNFERIAGGGIQQARALNDPTLRAHLRYNDWSRLCASQPGISPGMRPFRGMTTADMQAQCWDNLEAFKNQMQEEGTW